jgi:hypothetical protein
MSEEVLHDLRNETSVMSPNSAHEVISIKLKEGVDVVKQEEMIPVPISWPPIKAEQDGVSYLYLCPNLDTFLQYPEMLAVLCCLQLSVCPKTTLW